MNKDVSKFKPVSSFTYIIKYYIVYLTFNILNHVSNRLIISTNVFFLLNPITIQRTVPSY